MNNDEPIPNEQGDADISPVEENTTPTAPLTPVSAEPKQNKFAGVFNSKKQVILAAVVAVLILVGGAVAYVVMNQASDDSPAATGNKSVAKMGLGVTVADGTVTYQQPGDDEFAQLTTETQLSEGAEVKTAGESRAVLAFDDGSALRLDANTTIVLRSLAADDIQIEQVVGQAYSRVVASDRSYAVIVGDMSYEALGTAFSTLAFEGEQGVRVFQSKVKVAGVNGDVGEGKQYFAVNSQTDLSGKVTDLNVDALAKDAFMKWNLAEDEKTEKFKDKMGVLAQVKQRSAQLTNDELAAEKARLEAEALAKAEAEKRARLEAEKKALANKTTVTRGTMTLSLSGSKFSWGYSGKAIYGYKLVYSKQNQVPAFGEADATYFSGIDQTMGSIPDSSKIGSGTFYVRVCAYTAGTQSEGCVDYSPVVTITQ